MTASINSPADAVNAALVGLGYRLRVGDLLDGSDASKSALDIYGTTRDTLLREGEWAFAEGNISLTLEKQAPASYLDPATPWSTAYPPLPWFYQYAYPADCLKVRAVKSPQVIVPNFDPQPFIFAVANDNTVNPTQRILLCNVPNAVLTYTRRVTNLTNWDQGFVDAFIMMLRKALALRLADLNAERVTTSEAASADTMAMREQG